MTVGGPPPPAASKVRSVRQGALPKVDVVAKADGKRRGEVSDEGC